MQLPLEYISSAFMMQEDLTLRIILLKGHGDPLCLVLFLR